MDQKNRLWFCGRKSHRVIISENETLYTIPCEAVFNQHPRVFRCALVGVGPVPHQTPVLCVELELHDSGENKRGLSMELLNLASNYPHTESIKTIFFHRGFPVDIRHNSKIFREQMAFWAEKKLNADTSDFMDLGNAFFERIKKSGMAFKKFKKLIVRK
ncbi:hypothetical protein GMMP15_1290006 [Candidatus Magnetomoraceae bacterium gMMP-15]